MKGILYSIYGDELSILIKGEDHLPQNEILEKFPLDFKLDDETMVYLSEKKSDVEKHHWMEISHIKKMAGPDGRTLCQLLSSFWPQFPSYKKDLTISLPWPFTIITQAQDEILLFGGSFNPLHEGHRECIRKGLSSGVIMIPDNNPLKIATKEKCAFSELRDLADQLNGLTPPIYPGFCGMDAANPTFEWLSKVRSKRKILLMGDDNLDTFTSWHRSEDLIRELYGVKIVPRLYSKEVIQEKCRLIFKDKGLLIDIYNSNPFSSISSTSLREKFKRDLNN